MNYTTLHTIDLSKQTDEFTIDDDVATVALILISKNICVYCHTTDTPQFRKTFYNGIPLLACNACKLRSVRESNICSKCSLVLQIGNNGKTKYCRWCQNDNLVPMDNETITCQ